MPMECACEYHQILWYSYVAKAEIASYPGLPLQLFAQPWRKKRLIKCSTLYLPITFFFPRLRKKKAVRLKQRQSIYEV